jgi:hypothetical protein
MIVSKGWHSENGSKANANLYAILTIALLMTLFFFVHPIVSTRDPGKGSDRNEALNIAATELLHGRYPYYCRTHLGSPISPLPGAVILALPFMAIGNSAYQNFFWLIIFFFLAGAYLRDKLLSLLLILFTLLGSPLILHEIVTGGDLLANSLYIAAIVIVFANPFYGMKETVKLGFSIFAGIAMSSRPYVLLIIPIILGLLRSRLGFKAALKYGGVMVCMFLAVTLPFWIYSPLGFSPLYTYSKLSRIDSLLPGARVGVIGATLMLSCFFSFYKLSPDAFLGRCAAVFYFIIGISVILESLVYGFVRLQLFPYALPGLFIGAFSVWVSLKRDISFLQDKTRYEADADFV